MFVWSLTRILNAVMLVSEPATKVPETTEFALVVTLQSLPGGVAGAPFGTQSTGTEKSRSVVVADCVYGPMHPLGVQLRVSVIRSFTTAVMSVLDPPFGS